jgi:hypothetical protein
MMRLARSLQLGLLAAILGAGPVTAQQLRRIGRGTPRLDARVDAILRNPEYRILTRDTVVARDDTLQGPVLTLGNRLVIEGTVRGDLAIIDANVYARPGARIEGDVTNIGGGFYRSEQAVITGSVSDHPLAPYHVEKTEERITIVGDVEHRYFRAALQPPQANRVDGFRPYLGAVFVTPGLGRFSFELQGWVAYGLEAESEEALQGGGELRLRRGLNHLGVGVEKTTWTNDAWNRGDLDNTIVFLWHGRDYRNYYEAQRQYVVLARELVRGPHEAVLALRGQREDGASRLAGDPWVLLSPDSFRVNPAIDDGVITSAIVSLKGEWTGQHALAKYDGAIEVARQNVFDGQHDFQAFRAWGTWAMQALANHTLEFEGYFQGPLGSDSLPRQRWSILGGSGTLNTFEIGEFLGDRLVYLESKYSIPLGPRLRVPLLGAPRLQFLHHIGMAWTFDESRSFQQNAGLRIQFPFVFARVITNPADTDDTEFSVGVTFPRSAYPWERRSADRR